jgi:ArsR family transcriptional regulator
LKQERVDAAQAFFQAHAAQWDSIRSLHLAEAEVEAEMLAALGPGPFDLLVDLGTGTGRILELFAGRYRRGIGVDASQPMLAYARARLDRSNLLKAQVRQGDICHLAIDDGVAGAVVMHQVLHYLTDPGRAVAEAARILQPDGRLMLVDFAPHELEFLRDEFAHVRLGIAPGEVAQWLDDAGLELIEARDLAPMGGDSKLTVSIWVAACRQTAAGWRGDGGIARTPEMTQ